MKVRKLEIKDKFDAYLVSAFCFHNRVDNVEEKRAEVENENFEDWGAFDEKETLAARIINNKYKFLIDGTAVEAGGIGAVSTLPEFRNSGAVRDIFNVLLPEAYKNGEVISTLYPFKQAFYRKFGYEVITHKNDYEMRPDDLYGFYSFDGDVKRWNPGDPVDEFLDVYNIWSKDYNLCAVRDKKLMLDHMKVDSLYKDRKFSYIFSKDGQNIAYLIFTDTYNPDAAILNIDECAWINREGFNAILAFLGRFEADYGKIVLPLPAGVDLLRIIKTEVAYRINKISKQDFMLRVINVEKLLETIKKSPDCDFYIRVFDDIITENNGMWHVTANEVVKTQVRIMPNLILDQKVLGQLAIGALSIEEAKLQPGVEIFGDTDMLSRMFVQKPVFVGEHF